MNPLQLHLFLHREGRVHQALRVPQVEEGVCPHRRQGLRRQGTQLRRRRPPPGEDQEGRAQRHGGQRLHVLGRLRVQPRDVLSSLVSHINIRISIADCN